MKYIFVLCSNDPERKEDINQLVQDFNELVYKKYPDCVILKGNIKVKFFTDLECKMGKMKGYRPYCVLGYYDKKGLAKKIIGVMNNEKNENIV